MGHSNQQVQENRSKCEAFGGDREAPERVGGVKSTLNHLVSGYSLHKGGPGLPGKKRVKIIPFSKCGKNEKKKKKHIKKDEGPTNLPQGELGSDTLSETLGTVRAT